MSHVTQSYILPDHVLTMRDYERHTRHKVDQLGPQTDQPRDPKLIQEMRKRKEQVIISQFNEIVRYIKEGAGEEGERFGRMAQEPRGKRGRRKQVTT